MVRTPRCRRAARRLALLERAQHGSAKASPTMTIRVTRSRSTTRHSSSGSKCATRGARRVPPESSAGIAPTPQAGAVHERTGRQADVGRRARRCAATNGGDRLARCSATGWSSPSSADGPEEPLGEGPLARTSRPWASRSCRRCRACRRRRRLAPGGPAARATADQRLEAHGARRGAPPPSSISTSSVELRQLVADAADRSPERRVEHQRLGVGVVEQVASSSSR